MGLSRLLRRIYNMIFRDFLFRIPKKYLVVVIIFLVYFILTDTHFVFGYSNYDEIEVDDALIDNVYYKQGYIQSGWMFDTGIPAPYYRNSDSSFYDNYKYDYRIAFTSSAIGGSWGYVFHNGNVNEPTQFANWFRNVGQNNYLSWGGTSSDMGYYSANTDYHFIVNLLPERNLHSYYDVFDENDNLLNTGFLTMGTTDFNTDGTQTIHLSYNTNVLYQNFKIYEFFTNQWDLIYNIYPCKYRDTSSGSIQYLKGFYDLVSNKFIVYDKLELDENDMLSSPPQEIIDANTTPTPTPTDYTNVIQNVDNSINNLNDNIMSEDTTGIDTTINTPTVTSTQATQLLNIFNTSVQNWIDLLEDEDSIHSITIYLPNFLDKNNPYTITLYSNMVKDALNGVNIPGFNFNAYFAIQLFWYLTLGGYLVHLLLRLYQAFTDGEITNLSSWSKKINDEYTKISMFII